MSIRLRKIAASAVLAVGMSLPAVGGIGAWAGPIGPGNQLATDVASGQSGEQADANDTDSAAEFDSEDAQLSQVTEQETSNDVGESSTAAKDQGGIGDQNVSADQGGVGDQNASADQGGVGDQSSTNDSNDQADQGDSSDQG